MQTMPMALSSPQGAYGAQNDVAVRGGGGTQLRPRPWPFGSQARSAQVRGATLTFSECPGPPSAGRGGARPLVVRHRHEADTAPCVPLPHIVSVHGGAILCGRRRRSDGQWQDDTYVGCFLPPELPQYLLEAGWAAEAQQIVCTQPRRIAATSVAARVAQETGTRLGDDIGYAIRFEECTHPTRTRIRYTTPGMLFRECMQDPLLQRYSVILIDEAHERGAYTDLLMALLKK